VTWAEQWRALAARIEGLVAAGDLMAAALKVGSGDELDVGNKALMPELAAIVRELRGLEQSHGAAIPPEALGALRRFVGQGWDQRALGLSAGLAAGLMATKALVPLAAFRGEFEYLVRDAELEGRSVVELAFEHLRRTIAVDEEVRTKWVVAFEKHETRCERLGAVHLLSHRIWAFKVSAAGAATDLVFAEPLPDHLPAATGPLAPWCSPSGSWCGNLPSSPRRLARPADRQRSTPPAPWAAPS